MIKREGAPQGQVPTNILYIGLIPFEWDEENLKAVVCPTGNVIDVRLGFDHVGKNKGYAFIEYENPPQAVKGKELLGQVNITQHGNSLIRRLRIELSREGYKAGSTDKRAVLKFQPQRVPPGVQFPQEVLSNYPQLQHAPNFPPAGFQPLMPQPPAHTNGQYRQNTYSPHTQATAAASQPPRVVNQAPPKNPNQPGIPDDLLQAANTLPRVAELPFAKPDKINENLGSIPPPELIQLIANMKTMLSLTNAARAGDVFQISPNLATATAQALLLMGFVNEEVIQEAMKAGSGTPQPQVPPQQYNQNYQQGFGQPPQGANGGYQQNFGQPQTYGNQTYNQQYNNRGFQQSPPPPPHPAQSSQGKWPHLPLSTQMKLSNVAPDQAELIAQVLSLGPDQISALPPDRQQMVASIRQQYL